MTVTRHIGLMSGTSADGIDAALVDIDQNGRPELVRTLEYALPAQIQHRIETIIRDSATDNSAGIDDVLGLDCDLGHCFADAVDALLNNETAHAIGSHGQTVLHRPQRHYTLQLGSGAVIAERTGITTITDFRSRDMVLAGEGAPLAPAFHNAVFRDRDENRAIVNIGGIANLTSLPANVNAPVLGFDCGPGNTLMDGWCRRHRNTAFDADGSWAREGQIDESLLGCLLDDGYLNLAPPKSTGREYFHLRRLDEQLQEFSTSPVDVQATLAEFTARGICDAIARHFEAAGSLFVCGGGAFNTYLLERIRANFQGPVATTAKLGVDPDWVEAIAFAWLGWRTLNGLSGNLPDVTGASRAAVMGCIWPALKK